jgi:signal transduction histidine kinase
VICYGGWCFGTLIQGARYMAQGNLYHQIPTRYMYGAFRDFAIQLNSLAGAAQIAAERQLRSERMKTELITNVSHDIKTPLTSIINYVDLLKLPHSEEDSELYLEVLDRQSQRLKKLVDDLMEMSKASTGNMSVEVCPMDAVETITQVLGEFSDKLARACLTPVFRAPEEPVTMLADGRLVWRVMSNLLGNAVKYAMPNTRLYIDLASVDGRVIISLKNISREELNVRADELLERFVRGDLSRNTEGSGLGLNIAQSLMELQKGQLQLLVDGDLFKVTLIFPCA